jgi:putative transposase
MKTNAIAPNYKGFRFPPEIISHAVWLSFRFSLSFRDVEELLAPRGIIVTYETVRQRCLKFGQTYANELRRRRPRCGDKWYMDEVFLTIRGERHASRGEREIKRQTSSTFWFRADETKKRRNASFGNCAYGLQYVPRVIITDKLKRYAAAKREILLGVQHRQHKGLGHPSGKLAPTHAAAREEDATLQITQTGATLPFCLRPLLRPFPTATTSYACAGISCHFTGPIPDVE